MTNMRRTPTVGDMSSTPADWWEYVDAAGRKILIASYHTEKLAALCGETGALIAIQAHFEGVLFAFVAASDQTAEALNLMKGLEIHNPNLETVLNAYPEGPLRTQLFKWHNAPIAGDIRAIRRLAVHHHYEKTPQGPRLVLRCRYSNSEILRDRLTKLIGGLSPP